MALRDPYFVYKEVKFVEFVKELSTEFWLFWAALQKIS